MVGLPIIIVGSVILIICIYKLITISNVYKELGDQQLKEDLNVNEEDALSMIGVSVEYLSEMFGVPEPKYEIGSLKDSGIDNAMAIYSGSFKTIFVDLEFLFKNKYTLYEFFYLVCHEFQHYLDHMSIGDLTMWAEEYQNYKEYYEMKSDDFADKETMKLIKHFVTLCKENENS